MDILDSHHLRSDIVNRLLGGEEDEATLHLSIDW